MKIADGLVINHLVLRLNKDSLA
jgi:hypothetical protein